MAKLLKISCTSPSSYRSREPAHVGFVRDAGIVLTNDGNAILREIDVSHPAAKVGTPSALKSVCWLKRRPQSLSAQALCSNCNSL